MSENPLIHVVDDDDALRTALLRLLSAAGFEARGYPSAGEFLLRPPTAQPGCLILDIKLPGPSGLDLHSALVKQGRTLPVIFLTGHATVAASVRAMKDGAVDFLTKPVERNVLFEAIQRALALDAEWRRARVEATELRERFATLTAHEREIFDLIVAGKLNKQIADEVGLAERTVKLHRAHVMAKLNANSAAELGQLAERLRHLSDLRHHSTPLDPPA